MENILEMNASSHALLTSFYEMQRSPSFDQADRQVASQTYRTLTVLFHSTIQRNIDSFLEKLEQSTSSMKQTYAATIRVNNAFIRNSLARLERIFTTLEESATKQFSAAISAFTPDHALIKESVQEADVSCRLYTEIFSAISVQFPKQHPLYPEFLAIHTFNQAELPILHMKVTRIFEITTNHLVFHGKKEQKTSSEYFQLKVNLQKALLHSVEELLLFNQVSGITENPISPQMLALDQISFFVKSLISPSGKLIPQSFVVKLQSFQKEEPKLAPDYATLLELLSSQFLNMAAIGKKIIELKEKLSARMHLLIQKYKNIAATNKEQLGKSHSDSVLTRKKCENPFCISPPKAKASSALELMKETSITCSRCIKAIYCSKACQSEDWNRHRFECKKLNPLISDHD